MVRELLLTSGLNQEQMASIWNLSDIDRDGMVDMLFITDKKNMNFIVNYNMLESPTALNEV